VEFLKKNVSSEGAIREEGHEPLNKLIDSLGGWPVAVGPQWTKTVSVEELIGINKYSFVLPLLEMKRFYAFFSPFCLPLYRKNQISAQYGHLN